MTDYFHYYELILVDGVQPAPGRFVALVDTDTLQRADLFGDANGTPIVSSSGVANMAKTDDLGNVSAYVAPDTYHVDIYEKDATTFVWRISNVSMTSAKGEKGDPGIQGATGPADNTYSDLASFKASNIDRKVASLSGVDGIADGKFFWETANAPYTADDTNIIKSDANDLSVGAWVRQKAQGILAADGNTVQQNLDHGGSFTPSGASAVSRPTADVLAAFGLQAKSFGAAEDGATDDRTPLADLLASASSIAIMPGAYAVSAGPANPNPAASDPNPSALTITKSDFVLDGLGTGALIGTGADKGILHIKNASEADRPCRGVIRNFRKLTQAYGSPELGGLNDDYFAIRAEGVYDWLFADNHIDSCELGFTDQFVQTSVYCTYYTFDAATDVSTANDTVTINKDLAGAAATHDFVTGSKVAMSMGGGSATPSAWSLTGATPPTGLTAPFRFYAIVVDTTTIKLAASYEDAIAGTAIDITAVGSGTITIIRMERGSKRNILSNFTIAKCAYLGVQLAGCEFGSYTDISIAGMAADGTSRGVQHGVRSDGFFMALTANNYIEASVSRMVNGLSLQSWSEHNTFHIAADDCQNGVQTTLPTDYVAAAKHNTIYITANRCDYGIYEQGNSYNTYVVDILDPRIRGINATNGGAGTGLATGNTYRGRIRRTQPGSTVRLAQLDGPSTKVDLELEGSGSTSADTGYGMLSTGADIFGSVRVRNCQTGVLLNGTGSQLFVKASNCVAALTITGSNHVVFADIDGNVSITGNNNTVIGRVSGTVTNTGTGNRIQVVAQAGWTAGTGTANKGAFAAYAGATMSAAYAQAEAQATNDAVKAASQRLLALEQAVRIAGLIT